MTELLAPLMLLKIKCVLFQNLVKTKHTAINVVAVSAQLMMPKDPDFVTPQVVK